MRIIWFILTVARLAFGSGVRIHNDFSQLDSSAIIGVVEWRDVLKDAIDFATYYFK